MPPVSDSERLMALHGELQAALQSNDWTAVATVDAAIRQGLQACAEECERLRLLLLNHLEHAEGRAAYQRIDMFQAGDRG